MAVRAIRGATQVEIDTPEAIGLATQELLKEMMAANSATPESVISVLLTATPDLTSTFPAAAAREVGFSNVPLMCAVEIDVPGALARVVRAMATVETELTKDQISHIYLHGAKVLRTDIAQ